MTKKPTAGEKPKPRTKKEIEDLGKKVAHASGMTEPGSIEILTEQDLIIPGLTPYDLVKAAFGETTAKATFDAKPKQGVLPRKRPSGPELTNELCNLEMKLRKKKAELEKEEASLELAKAAVKTVEAEVGKVQDAIAEALYDLRSGQGHIEFPEPKAGDAAKAAPKTDEKAA